MAASQRASATAFSQLIFFARRDSISWRGRLPALAPTRTGMLCLSSLPAISFKATGSRMMPGLSRTAAQPESMAATAISTANWISAMTGRGELAVMSFNASASAGVSTETRMISQPMAASSRIWARVASASEVRVLHMDWMVTGEAEPTGTVPMEKLRVWRRRIIWFPPECCCCGFCDRACRCQKW